MGTEIVPPKQENPLGILLAIIGFIFIIWGLYKLYILYGPTIPSSKIKAPVVNNVPEATNTTNITLKGRSYPNSIVIIKENSKTLTQTTTDKTGYFKTPITLTPGTHKLNLTVVTKKILKLRPKKPQEISITVDLTRPEIKKLSYPKTLKTNKLSFSGELTEPAKIVVQAGDQTIWEKHLPAGNFTETVNLRNLNSTKLYIFAVDKSGNISKTAVLNVKLPTKVLSAKAQKELRAKTIPDSAGFVDNAVDFIKKNIIITYLTVLIIGAYFTSYLGIKFVSGKA